MMIVVGKKEAAPATMRNVLRTYLEHDGPDGPLLRPLAEAAVRSDVAMAVFGGGAGARVAFIQITSELRHWRAPENVFAINGFL